MLFTVTQEMHTWAVRPKQHCTRGGEGARLYSLSTRWLHVAKLKIAWKCLSSFVQGCSSKSVDKILMHGNVIHWNLAWVSSRGLLVQFGKILAVEPHFPPQLCHKNLPRLTHQWACSQAITRPAHVGVGLFYSSLQMAITLGKASNMVLIATKTPLTRNVFDMSLVVGSRELFPEVPEVTPIWYGSFAVRIFFLPRNTWSIWSR